MSNNHKQKVYSVLDSLTQKELEQYMKDRNINLKRDSIVDKLSRFRKTDTHREKISQDISTKFSNNLQSYYSFAQANIITFILEYLYDDTYKIKDLKEYLHEIMKSNKELKEMVYDIMKDF